MPFVRISLSKGLSQKVRDYISQAVHQSLIQDFNIPENDYFHIIEELDGSQIKYPSSYLGISHTGNMIFIEITAGAGRTVQQKERLYSRIAKSISAETNFRIEDIIIVLTENSVNDWSFGLGERQLFSHLAVNSMTRTDLLTVQLNNEQTLSRIENMNINKIIPCLWFKSNGGTISKIIEYYKTIFGSNFKEGSIIPLGETPSGHTEIFEVQIFGQRYSLMSTAEKHHPLNDAVSFMINCKDQNEIDKYWDYFTHEGEKSQCGWCIDKYGLRWQVVPENMEELMNKPNAFDVMMKQRKIIIAEYLK